MKRLISMVHLSVGLKVVIAVTGLIMAAFAFFHLGNNIHIYWGQQIYNEYGFAWKKPGVIETARVVLSVSFVLHIIAVIWVTRINRRARRQSYAGFRYSLTTWSGRIMVLSGVFLGIFIIYHVLHAKVGFIHPSLHEGIDAWGNKDVYNLIVTTLRHPITGAVYFFGLTGLFAHLHHGIQSTLSSLGVAQDLRGKRIRRTCQVLATLLYIGYVSIPVSAWLGILRPVVEGG